MWLWHGSSRGDVWETQAKWAENRGEQQPARAVGKDWISSQEQWVASTQRSFCWLPGGVMTRAWRRQKGEAEEQLGDCRVDQAGDAGPAKWEVTGLHTGKPELGS